MDLKLKGKRVMVTASSSGIGATVAQAFASEGCDLLIHGRDNSRTQRVLQQIQDLGGSADMILGDFASDIECDKIVTKARAWAPDILVNNAGPFSENTWEDVAPADWLSTINLNVVSAARLSQAVLPTMREQEWGRIVNIGSRAAVRALPNMVDYSAAKAAIVNMTISLAQHLAGSGITVNCVSPGVILSSGLETMFKERAVAEGRPQSEWQEIARRYAPNPSGRLGTAADIASDELFIASPLADYVNGTNLKIDGGITGV